MYYTVQTKLHSPDCSRTPGFKSSLNRVHLKIHHALKETSHPTDRSRVADLNWIAISIGNFLCSPRRGKMCFGKIRFHWSDVPAEKNSSSVNAGTDGQLSSGKTSAVGMNALQILEIKKLKWFCFCYLQSPPWFARC